MLPWDLLSQFGDPWTYSIFTSSSTERVLYELRSFGGFKQLNTITFLCPRFFPPFQNDSQKSSFHLSLLLLFSVGVTHFLLHFDSYQPLGRAQSVTRLWRHRSWRTHWWWCMTWAHPVLFSALGDQQIWRSLRSRAHCWTPGFGQKCPWL